MLRAISNHDFEPVIDTRYTFADVRQAFEHMDANGHVGKIIVEPWK